MPRVLTSRQRNRLLGRARAARGESRDFAAPAPSDRIPDSVPSEELAAFPPLTDPRYAPLEFLGDGGMGRVYKAFDRQLGRVVALKFLKRLDENTLERFLQEARAQAQIEHPNVANIYNVGQAGDVPFLAMRFIHGPTLRAALPELNLEQKVLIIRDVAEALHACHRVGVIHRDVKPTNVMLERTDKGDWWPFVMDFGLARELGSEGSVTVSGVIVGTPVYCSPEQVQGRVGDVDRRSDVYGLGATLYECLAGAAPFSAVGGLVALIRRISEEDPVPLSRRQANLPVDLERIVARAMEKDPGRRYPSARALAEDLTRFLNGDPVEARRASLAYRLAKRIRKNRALAAVIAGSSLVILALAGLGLTLAFRARSLAQSAQRFGREAERMEVQLFKAYALPLHDVRPERRRVLDRITQLRSELASQGGWSQAPGRLALGRGLMALGHFEEARSELETAWRACRGRDPEVAQALGLVLARLYEQEMEGLRGPLREDRKRALEGEYLRPARELLRRAKAGASEDTPFVEAVLALVEERWEDARRLARETQRQLPWRFEAWALEADLDRYQANECLGRGAFAEAEAHLEEAGAALARAREVGRSAPSVYESEVQRRLARFQLRMDQGRADRRDRDWALEAVDDALRADPEDWKVLAYASVIHRRWGTALLEAHQDPTPALEEAIRCARAGLALRPADTPLLNNLGTALRYKAQWESERGQDPRPTLAEAVEALSKAMDRPAFLDFLLNNLGNCHSLQATWELNHGADPRNSAAQAAACFQRASALRPWVGHASSEAMVHQDEATFLRWQGQDARPASDAAFRAIETALALNGRSFQAHREKGEICLERAAARIAAREPAEEDLRQAERAFEAATELNKSLAAYAGLKQARILALRAAAGSSASAAQAAQRLEVLGRTALPVELAPLLAEAVLSLPKASRGLVASALRSLERARRDRPWDGWLRLLEGRLLQRLGRSREGAAALKEAEALNGNLRPLLLRDLKAL